MTPLAPARPGRFGRLVRLHRLVVVISLAIACKSATTNTDIVARDSNGVHIVETMTSPWTTSDAWVVQPQPTLDIGSINGPPEYQFDRIAGVVQFDDGSVIVADAGSGQIRVFDANGRFVSSTGRPGGGPGEYRQIVSIGLDPNDSLWVYDFGARRFTILDDSAHFVRTMNLGGELSNIGAVGRLQDGSFVVREYWSSRSQSDPTLLGLSRSPAAVVRVARDGQVMDTVGLYLGREVVLGEEGGRRTMSSPPFARSTNVVLRGNAVIVGEQSAFEVATYATNGHLQSILRAPNVRLRLDESDVAAYVEREVSGLPQSEQPARRRFLENLAVPETRPAYGDLQVARDGNLWVAEYVFPGSTPRRWVVFLPDGTPVGTVTVPERFAVYDIGPGWMAGVWHDDLDVEHVQTYRLVRPDA